MNAHQERSNPTHMKIHEWYSPVLSFRPMSNMDNDQQDQIGYTISKDEIAMHCSPEGTIVLSAIPLDIND